MSIFQEENDPYKAAKDLGIFRTIKSPRDITTTTIIRRIVSHYEAYKVLFLFFSDPFNPRGCQCSTICTKICALLCVFRKGMTRRWRARKSTTKEKLTSLVIKRMLPDIEWHDMTWRNESVKNNVILFISPGFILSSWHRWAYGVKGGEKQILKSFLISRGDTSKCWKSVGFLVPFAF